MTTKLIIRNILFGFLTWLIPFAASVLLYGRDGQLTISHDLFKSIIVVMGSLTGCLFLYLYFRKADKQYLLNGLIVGLSWFAINIILDAVILIPMMKVNFSTYFLSIGMGYLVIPIMSFTMGLILSGKTSKA